MSVGLAVGARVINGLVVSSGVGVLSSIGVGLAVTPGASGVGVGGCVAAGRAQPTNAISASSARFSRADTAE